MSARRLRCRMLSRHHWITEFIGHVLRRGLSNDPDWAFDTASEVYPELGDLAPDVAADSAFSPDEIVSASTARAVGLEAAPLTAEGAG